jgi:hypothetical protein
MVNVANKVEMIWLVIWEGNQTTRQAISNKKINNGFQQRSSDRSGSAVIQDQLEC